ncbi:MAG: hypothetical protein ACE5JX_04980 [Acidobacteriota bacterium]
MNGTVPPGAKKEAETDDPMELVLNFVPGGDPEFMARCIIEEYARMGMDEEAILGLFSQPVYQTYHLYQERGSAWVRDLIRHILSQTGRMRISVQVSDQEGGRDV